jgi:hypothetical protein
MIKESDILAALADDLATHGYPEHDIRKTRERAEEERAKERESPSCLICVGVACETPRPCPGCETWQGRGGHNPPYLWLGRDDYDRTYQQAWRAAMWARVGKDEHGVPISGQEHKEYMLGQFMRDGEFAYPKAEDYTTPEWRLDDARADYFEAMAEKADKEADKLARMIPLEGALHHGFWTDRERQQREGAKELRRRAAKCRAQALRDIGL